MAKSTGKQSIIRRAIRIDQNTQHPLFMFALSGTELMQIADISRISRDETGKLIGYQRADVKRHVQDITDYLNQEEIVFPNSIILAFSSTVKFKLSRGPTVAEKFGVPGILEIPIPNNGGPKPAWIVDGQQRAIALTMSKRKDFPVPINAFVADEIEIQRDQFLRVNSSKPLPRGLITELLPEVSSSLPTNLSKRQMPSAICDWLNREKTSPFFQLIRRASTKGTDSGKAAVIADTSIVKMLEESLETGCLFPYRNIVTNETDFDSIYKILAAYWSAVTRVFPDAWGKSPDKSRLMHGAGIRSMGRLMDRIMADISPNEKDASPRAESELRKVSETCRWTKGRWEQLDELKWDEVQNVPRHINILSNYLLRAYLHAKKDS